MLPVVGVLALGAYNLSTGNHLLHVPGARTLRSTLTGTVSHTVRDGVRNAARERGAEVRERAAAGVRDGVDTAEHAMSTITLTSKIKAKMALDDVVRASDIDVDVDEGIVTLTGDVASKDEQRRAVRIATETDGVTEVVNRLKTR
jgi:hyperosmotically inducible periplasmic protein